MAESTTIPAYAKYDEAEEVRDFRGTTRRALIDAGWLVRRRFRRALDNYSCPFCRIPLLTTLIPSDLLLRCEASGMVLSCSECSSCGFWKILHVYEDTSGHSGFFRENSIGHYAVGKLEEYPIGSSTVPIDEIKRYVSKDPERLRSIHWRALEQLVAECFKSTGDYAEVMHVGKSSDGGVDILLVTTDTEKILVQVKRRTKPSTESVATVRNLLGAMIAEGCLRGIIVSTADHFSWAADKLVSRLRHDRRGYRIDLSDYGKLRQMVTSISTTEPWQSYLATACENIEYINDCQWHLLGGMGFNSKNPTVRLSGRIGTLLDNAELVNEMFLNTPTRDAPTFSEYCLQILRLMDSHKDLKIEHGGRLVNNARFNIIFDELREI